MSYPVNELKMFNNKLLYLHGFRSSPKSAKARLLAQRMHAQGRADHWACPQLNVAPQLAITTACTLLDTWVHSGTSIDQIAIVGSSLGGFYATWLAEQYGCRCVLLNPAITPWHDLHRYLGEQPLWHGEGSVIVEAHHMDELLRFSVPSISKPQRYFLLAATGDEIIDYRTMLQHYSDVRVELIQGSDHGLSNFSEYLDEVFAFCVDEINSVNK